MNLDLQLLGAFLLFVAVIGLACFVALHNPRVAVNRRFAVMALTTAGWIITISLALATTHSAHTITLGRLGFAFASGIPFSLVWLVDALAEAPQPRRRFRLIVPGFFCFVFVLISLSPGIVAGAKYGVPRANFVYGPFHRFFGLYFLLCFAYGLFTLWKTITSATGLRKLQLRYLLLGVSLTGAGAISTNLLIPLVWRTSQYSILGPYFSLLFFSFSAHAIIRHRLMDVRVFIRKGVVYVSAILASATTFALLAQLLAYGMNYQRDTVPLIGALVMALSLAILFQPLKTRIQLYMNRYVYRETYDYQRAVREVSRRLSTILDLQSLLNYLTAAIESTFKVELVRVYLRDSATRLFVSRSAYQQPTDHPDPRAPRLSDSSPLVALLRRESGCLVREDVQRASADYLSLTAAQELGLLGGEVAFPLTEDTTIVGLIVVGPKRSGDPYFKEDIDFLSTLVSQAAVAMKNAQLYRQVVLINEYLDNILSTMESGVIAVDATGSITLFNPAAERLTGLKSDSLKRSTYHSLPHALSLPIRETVEDGRARPQIETSLQGPEGLIVPLVCSTATLQNREGSAEGALIVFSDLSRVKHLEREKRRAERLASFGALASGVAHEIKNPLVAIRTFAELLPDRFAERDFREEFSKVVVREIDRIDNLVARLRGIAASSPQQVGAVDIREPISETIALLRAQLDQGRITVRPCFEDSAPLVAIDEGQLKQLFLNLFLNAVEAMPLGGELTIRVSRKDNLGSRWVLIEVSDTGRGIPDSIRGNIFEPFFTTKPKGSGLGLAICRGITDAHGGTIRAEDNGSGRGTTVVIEFPLARLTDSPVERQPVPR